jgi:hypothetical protein
MTPAAALAPPPFAEEVMLSDAGPSEADAARGRVARGLRGARARAHLGEAEVVAILARQGIGLSVSMLRRAELSGTITLDLAACLADIYGTTTDGIAGRRLYCRRIGERGFLDRAH